MRLLLNKYRRRALMHHPSDAELRDYLECFTAGYKRGVADVRGLTPLDEWMQLTATIGAQLATDRSVMEAGCWLAGMRLAREDAIAGHDEAPARVSWRFCQGWESEYIGECALECDPTTVKFRKLLVAACLRRPSSISIRVMNALATN